MNCGYFSAQKSRVREGDRERDLPMFEKRTSKYGGYSIQSEKEKLSRQRGKEGRQRERERGIASQRVREVF